MADTAERTLRVMMRFGLDQGGLDAAKKGVSDLEKKFQAFAAQYGISREEADQALAAVAQASGKSKEALLQEADAVRKVTEAQKAYTDAHQAAMKAIQQTRVIARGWSSVGREMIMAGGAITAPIILAMHQYQTQFGAAEAGAQRWTDAMYRVEQANVRVGRVANAELVPVMEKVAGLAEDVAGFIEQNPEVIRAALMIGGSLVAIGTTLKLAAGVMQTIAAIQRVTAVTGVGAGAAGTAGTAGAAGAAAGTGIFGAGLLLAAPMVGALIGEAIVEKVGVGEEGGLGQRLKRGGQALAIPGLAVATRVAGLLEQLGWKGGGDAIRGFDAKLLEMSGLLDQTAGSAGQAAQALRGMGTEISLTPQNIQRLRPGLAIYENFQEEARTAARQYLEQQDAIRADAGERVLEVQKTYNKGMAEQEKRAREFYGDGKQAEADYYKGRLENAAKFGEESVKAEADHQRDLQQMSASHQLSMEQMFAKRDFAGVYWEQRRYEMERQNKEKEFAASQQERNADFAKQVIDEDAKFAQQRERRIAQFEQERRDQQAQLEASKNEQLKAIEDTKNESLGKLKEKYDAEVIQRANQLDLELAAIGIYIGRSEKAWAAYYKNLEDQFQAFVASGASGGAAGPFAPTAPATSAQGMTAQEKTLVDFVRAQAGAGTVAQSNTANINLTVNGSASDQDKAAIADLVRKTVAQGFRDAGVAP